MAKVIWLTGISGAGKSTLGGKALEYLRSRGKDAELLDGDAVREFFESDLGYSSAERRFNVRRIAFAAHKLTEHGIHTVVANIAPYYDVRDFVRRKLGSRYLQVYLKTDVALVRARDIKGLYTRADAGDETNVIGVDDDYDVPRAPDLTIDTGAQSEADSWDKLLAFLQGRGL